MKKLKRPALVTFVALGMFVSSGVAMAETSETEVIEETTDTELVVDTLFSFGYDLLNGLFLWNISTHDEPCALPTPGESEPAPEADPDPDCELTGGEVAGPNGQVNHGMFMKLFNSLYDGTGRGCVVRHLAQSDLGKGDQQVKGGDEVASDAPAVDDEPATEFTTIETSCQASDADDEVELEEGNGKPPWAGKPAGKGKPDSPGKSGDAPGKNK